MDKSCLESYFPNYDLIIKDEVIPNGFSRFEPLAKCNDSKIHVLFVSRFEEYKNFSLLKKIIAASDPDKLHFDIVTDTKGIEFINPLT